MIRFSLEVEQMLDGGWAWLVYAEDANGRRGLMGACSGFLTAELAIAEGAEVCAGLATIHPAPKAS